MEMTRNQISFLTSQLGVKFESPVRPGFTALDGHFTAVAGVLRHREGRGMCLVC